MVKTFYSQDPEDSSFTLVSYKNPKMSGLSRRDIQNLKRDKSIRARREARLMRDPMYVYRKNQEEYTLFWIRRLRKDPRVANPNEPSFCSPLTKDLIKIVTNEKGERQAVTKTIRVARNCPGCIQNVPLQYFHRGIACQFCLDLPIPVIQGQSHEPVIFDKRQRDADGNIVSTRSRITRTSGNDWRRRTTNNTGRHGPTESQATKIERQIDEEGVFERKVFNKDFIKKVIDRRLERSLTQEAIASMINRTVGEVKKFEKGELDFDAAMKSQLIWKLELSSNKASN